ncbi:MAG: hypothetical protein J4G18_17145 [Anaerolineae bacterium]|nr:hypothetical protein [Anaerolineae bacterium]
MSASTKRDKSEERPAPGNVRRSPSFLDYSLRTSRSQKSTLEKPDALNESEQQYIASLRRSIQQMKDGDVQPVREGLAELRRELAEDDEDDLMDT